MTHLWALLCSTPAAAGGREDGWTWQSCGGGRRGGRKEHRWAGEHKGGSRRKLDRRSDGDSCIVEESITLFFSFSHWMLVSPPLPPTGIQCRKIEILIPLYTPAPALPLQSRHAGGPHGFPAACSWVKIVTSVGTTPDQSTVHGSICGLLQFVWR